MKRKASVILMAVLLSVTFILYGCGGGGSKAEAQLSEEEKAMLGEWASQNEGEDSLRLSFQDDFTVAVTLNNQETEECTWTIKDETCVIAAEEGNISLMINEDGTLTAYYPSGEEDEWYVFECAKAE